MAEENTYTTVDEGVVSCNDCGACAPTEAMVIHYDTCTPGESKKWEKHHSENEE